MKHLIFALAVFAGLIVQVSAEINPAEEQLLKLRYNGKIAYDLYSEFYENWKLEVFYNIGESKVVQKMRMKEILTKFGITDPLENNYDRGMFDVDEIQSDYNSYLANGSTSKTNALLSCALLEERIYKDLGESINMISESNAKKELKQMRVTTGSHLKALVRALNRCGEIYTPSLLTENEFDRIMGSEKESFTISDD
jgi:hypothetical protein